MIGGIWAFGDTLFKGVFSFHPANIDPTNII